MDRGLWWAAVYRVAKSWTRLKGLSMLHTVGYEKLERFRFLFLWASGKDSPCSPGSPGPRLHWRKCGMVRQRNWLRAEFPVWGEKQRKGHLIPISDSALTDGGHLNRGPSLSRHLRLWLLSL